MREEYTHDFSDIAPIDDRDFHAAMASMIDEPGLEHAIRYVLPNIDYPAFKRLLLSINDKETFQTSVMLPFMEMMAKKTTSRLSISGVHHLEQGKQYTFITNHRDIVLDSAFLNLCLYRHGRSSTEIAIGSNLLIFPWIATLVKLNKCFIVKRGGNRMEALSAARQLSAYIDYAINEKGESVWIAQREGRAKDSSDTTQESLIKMLSLEGGSSVAGNLSRINLCPIAIAYEYDPNDYLKAREFLLRRRDPDFKKSKRDDLFSMETGLLQFKGRVHFSIGECLDKYIDRMPADLDRNAVLERIVDMIDLSIHASYKLYAINYIAHDALMRTRDYETLYTAVERDAFFAYLEHQLDSVDIPDVTADERSFMRDAILTMYANPLKNKKRARRILAER